MRIYVRRCEITRISQILTSVDGFGQNGNFDSDEQHLGVMVWENNFARIPFPQGLFCGDFDERYGTDDQGNLRRLVAGAGVLEFEALLGEERSPLFL